MVNNEMLAMILAGGRGSRLKDLTAGYAALPMSARRKCSPTAGALLWIASAQRPSQGLPR